MIPTGKPGPVTMLVTYRAKKGHEDALLALVKAHWPTLDRLGLVTKEPVRIWRASNREGRTAFVEMFQWKDEKAPGIAHQTPEVMAVWEPMGAVMEGMELAQIEPIDVAVDAA